MKPPENLFSLLNNGDPRSHPGLPIKDSLPLLLVPLWAQQLFLCWLASRSIPRP